MTRAQEITTLVLSFQEGVWDTAQDLYQRGSEILGSTGHTVGSTLTSVGSAAHEYPKTSGVATLGSAYLLRRHFKKRQRERSMDNY